MCVYLMMLSDAAGTCKSINQRASEYYRETTSKPQAILIDYSLALVPETPGPVKQECRHTLNRLFSTIDECNQQKRTK